MEDFQRPRRSAWLGLSSMATATSQCMNSLSLQLRVLRQKRFAFGSIAEKQKADVGMALESLGCARDRDFRTEIASHDIDGNSQFSDESRPSLFLRQLP
jgi:hypothetical protein